MAPPIESPLHTRAGGLSPSLWMYVGVVAVTVAAAYVPDIGRGFIKDDFAWIVESRSRTLDDIRQLFFPTGGFYRPIVSLSFAVNEYLSGLNPLPYGATNLALALATAAGVGWVVRLWRLPPAACVFAGAIWLLNVHGINMAVLWISGRTALLLTLFSVLAAAAAAGGRPATAAALAFCAMLSKEEAVLLPVPLLIIVLARAGRREIAVAAIGLAAAEAAYFTLRVSSGAITPDAAPVHYQFTFAWSQVVENFVQYADRACTFAVVALVLLLAIARTAPAPGAVERRIAFAGLVWLAAGFGLTVFLPVRSSLYACFPSIGSAWIGAAVATAIWRATPPRRQRVAAIVALVVPLALIPVYRARNVRWVELAVLSSGVMPGLEQAARAAQEGNALVVDERSTRVNIAAAFGPSIGHAFTLLAGERGSVWLVPPPPGSSPDEITPVPRWFHSAWVLDEGRLVRHAPGTWVGAPAVVFH